MKIYTKKGDTGSTSLLDGLSASKTSLTIECLGALDELNAHLGAIASGWIWSERSGHHRGLEGSEGIVSFLHDAQSWLLAIGAAIAGKTDAYTVSDIEKFVRQTEQNIDLLEAQLEPLKNFILPGGCSLACKLHIARAVARRAEREVVRWCDETKVGYAMVPMMNRLSDYLFVLARYANYAVGESDAIWKCST